MRVAVEHAGRLAGLDRALLLVAVVVYLAGVQLPTAIVGLDVNDWSGIRARYEEMRSLVESNGEVCHSFEPIL